MKTTSTVFGLLLCITICNSASVRKISCPSLRLKNGRVRYRQRTGFVQFQCNRSFLLAGEKYMKCTHGKWEGEVPTCVRNTCVKPAEPVHGFVYPSHRGGVLNFFCKPEYKLVGTATVFCDGTNWSSYLPNCLESNQTASLNCDFEREDMCGWSHDINDNFDWTRMKFSTPSGHIGTGPKHDHTPQQNGEGYYMYIEATSRNINDTARLISPVYEQVNNNTCFEFFYHMYGISAGELRVYLKKVGDSWDLNPDDAIFRRDGNQGDAWRRKFISLGSIDDDFQIVIEGVRGNSYLSDIAIDDVRIIENCMEAEPEEESTSISYDFSTDSYIQEETCANRCLNPASAYDKCDCNAECALFNRCCPDFEAICILDLYDSATMESSTDDISTIQYAYNSESNEIMQAITTTMQPTTTTTTQATIIPLISTINTNITTSNKIVTKLPFIIKKKPISITTTKAPITKKIPISITTTKAPIIKKKPVSTTTKASITKLIKTIKPNNNRQNEILDDVRTLPTKINEEERIILTLTTSGRIIGEKSQKIIKLEKESTISTALLIIAVTIVTGVVVTVLLIKRRYMCMRFRNMRNSSYGDSQSDVRFLTSDEVLDFTLQTN